MIDSCSILHVCYEDKVNQEFNDPISELIWQTRDKNGSQVPRGTRSFGNGMIKPLLLCSKAKDCRSVFVVTF